jgi:NAD(P)-dependent dehydrogenase (short-subunit alcohol dehydrogenase family)
MGRNTSQIPAVSLIRAALLALIAVALLAGGAHAQNARRPDQRVVLITGSTDGLGRVVALRVADTGAHVIIHGRNRERGQAVVDEINKGGKGTAAFYAADLASLAQVKSFAQTILRDYDRLDVLVNNAGIWLTSGDRQVSADGHELHFAVNYLAGYALTRTLLPLITKTPNSRIVNVASVAQNALQFDNIMLEQGYSGGRGYGQSKLAQILFTMDLAKELEGKVIVNALHPATLMNTTMVRNAGAQPRSTVDDGANAVMQLVTGDVASGQYFNGMRAMRANAQAYDESAREQLRTLSARLTGIR